MRAPGRRQAAGAQRSAARAPPRALARAGNACPGANSSVRRAARLPRAHRASSPSCRALRPPGPRPGRSHAPRQPHLRWEKAIGAGGARCRGRATLSHSGGAFGRRGLLLRDPSRGRMRCRNAGVPGTTLAAVHCGALLDLPGFGPRRPAAVLPRSCTWPALRSSLCKGSRPPQSLFPCAPHLAPNARPWAPNTRCVPQLGSRKRRRLGARRRQGCTQVPPDAAQPPPPARPRRGGSPSTRHATAPALWP